MDIEVSLMYTPIQSQKTRLKENLIACFNCSASSKALLFFSIHSIQKRHKRAALCAFFLFFPINKPCQLRRVPLTEECKSLQIGEKTVAARFSLWSNVGAYDQPTLLPLDTCSIYSVYSNPSLADQVSIPFSRPIPKQRNPILMSPMNFIQCLWGKAH